MTASRVRIFGIALLMLASAVFYVVRDVRIDSDYSAFLPVGGSETQQAFMRELRDGVASRIVLVELAGAPPEALADTSRKLTEALAADPNFRYVSNGSADFGRRELALLSRYRYVLSDGLDDPAHFAPANLRAALEARLEGLAGAAGMLDKALLATDPTGELRRVLARLTPPVSPQRVHGVWFDSTGTRALLLAETRASGADLAQQALAVDALRDAFAASRPAPSTTIEFSSPGTMALASRTLIAASVRTLSLVSIVLVLAILAWVYRSLPVVLLCVVPAAIGLLAGVVVVNVVFGAVHGITLAFGATVLGEAVDYPSYLLTQVRAEAPLPTVMTRFGRTLGLAVLTTACGAFALLWSGFPGLAQLGTLTIVGVLVAGAATWWLVPHAIPAQWLPATARVPAPVRGTSTDRRASSRRMRAIAAACIALAIVLAAWGKPWWDDDLATMNPLPAQYKARDIRLRSEIGAPDVRFALLVSAATREATLESAEALRSRLAGLVATGALASFDLVSDYVPSAATQARRRASLPPPDVLRADLDSAARGLPFRVEAFEPFVRAVADARAALPLTAGDYAGSALGLKVESTLREEGGRAQIVVPLAGVKDAAAIGRALPAGVRLLDLRGDATAMMAAYRQQAVASSAIGFGLIFATLALGLPGMRAAAQVLAPVVLAVAATAGLLVALGQPLTVFHYVALLLTAGVGVNYALVMALGAAGGRATGTWRTLAVVSATALATFGLLALSGAPVLRAIGQTVCIGVVLSLAFAALLIGGSARGVPAP